MQLATQIQDYLTQSSLSYCFELYNAYLYNSNTTLTNGSDTSKNSSNSSNSSKNAKNVDISDYSPLNGDVDTLFADYIHSNSMYPLRNNTDKGEYAIDMDQFVPLGQSNNNNNNNKAALKAGKNFKV